ncbi:MAG: ATP-binding protein [Firmicutes bacterium]|nr:ATP-binding protein [Bacillota bacterium]
MPVKNKILVVLAVVLVTFGAGMTVYSLDSYLQDRMDAMDDKLWETEKTIDDSVLNQIERFDEDLEYTATRENFLRGENQWIEKGDDSILLEAMRESSLANRNTFHAMLAAINDKVVLSSDENEYILGEKLGKEAYIVKSEGKSYIAIEYKVDSRLSYFGVMDGSRLYKNTISRMVSADGSVIMADKTASILLYDGESSKAAENVVINRGEKELVSFEEEIDDSHQNLRQVIMPSAKTKNRIFTISVSGDFKRSTVLFRKTTINIIIFLFVVSAGIMLLILQLVSGRRREVLRDLELEQLKEKNRTMEELTRKTQELAHHQRLETIGTLTSSIAHEFNNLLTPIMGYSLMTLEKIPETSSVYDDILEIYNASCKAKDIISRLSELSRKNTEMVFTEISPDALINKVMNVAAPALPKNVDVVRRLNCPGVKIFGNEIQLSQLFLNLIINAYQAMERNGGVLSVSTGIDDEKVCIEIKDTGEGIPEELQEKIFEPFFTTKDNGKGTGLGLAIAAQAIEDHGGIITVESEAGEGTVFKVFLTKFNG